MPWPAPAYRFLTRRALAALVTGEPNAVDPPMRRLTLTTISGVMIAALVAAGFAFVGLIRPNVGDKWKQTVFVVADPGQRYAAASVEALAGFGYGSVRPVTLPTRLVAMIPAGPALDPTAARRPASG